MFVSRGLRVVRARTVGGEGQHLKLAVTDGAVHLGCDRLPPGSLVDEHAGAGGFALPI